VTPDSALAHPPGVLASTLGDLVERRRHSRGACQRWPKRRRNHRQWFQQAFQALQRQRMTLKWLRLKPLRN